jgi:hypothetical protein
MIDFGLEPCPLCDGEAEVAQLRQGPEELAAVIKCTVCGLTLAWETEIKVGVSRSGKRTAAKAGLDPIEAWNRRAANCEKCGYRVYAEQMTKQHDCNDCGAAKSCEYMPQIGQTVRVNCPLWKPKEETQC